MPRPGPIAHLEIMSSSDDAKLEELKHLGAKLLLSSPTTPASPALLPRFRRGAVTTEAQVMADGKIAVIDPAVAHIAAASAGLRSPFVAAAGKKPF